MSELAVSSPQSTTPPASPSRARRWGPVARVIWTFRVEFAWVCVFSLILNLLMLTPTVYMLQVFDRVMSSGNLLTLLAISAIAVVLFLVMAFAEWLRSRLLVRSGGRFDAALNRQVFAGTFRDQLSAQRRQSLQPITDLNALRQFLTGNGVLAIAVVLFLVMAFAEWLRSRLLVRSGGRFDAALNRQVFAGTFRDQLSAQRRQSLQPITDLNALRQFLTGNGVLAIVDTPWTLVYLTVLFLMHPWLGWAGVGFCTLQLLLALGIQTLTSRRLKATQELAIEANQVLQAKMRNAETVEAMGMQADLRRQWMDAQDKQTRSQERSQEIQRRVQAFMKWVQYSQQGLMLALGALLAIDGRISAGAMVASNALMSNALRPIGVIVQVWAQFVEARQAILRLNDLLHRHPGDATAPPAPEVAGQISLRNLTATAPKREQAILDDLTADFEAGEVVAIVGPSGAGKSTLARCLLGIWPDTSGQVLLDGHDIREWPREELGPHVGYLPQDIELFDGTIAENIARFGTAPPAAIIEAAKRVGIHEMVLRLPDGYDTSIGEAGSVLSGGQRQRLGLARAIIGNPLLVVLDEPNANLDEAGETALITVLRDLKKRGTTVFMIVHQPSVLVAADRVLMLDRGRIGKLAKVVLTPPANPLETPKTTSP